MRSQRCVLRAVTACAKAVTGALGLAGLPAARKRSRRLLFRAVAICGCLAAVASGLVATAAAPAQAATVSASGPVTSGIAGKCLDDNGDGASNGTIVDLNDCSGAAAQNWSVMSDGTLQINGKCLDITGAGTSNGTKVEIWDCNTGGNQQWQQNGGALVNPASGRCLDDPGSSTTNGTQLQIYDCNGTPAQQWSLPSTVSTTGPVPLTYPGGDLNYSEYIPGISLSVANEVISTLWPQSVGGSGSSSLSQLMQDAYSLTAGSNPEEPQPPTFSGGYIAATQSDSGGTTITVNVPAADFQANWALPGWGASIIAAVIAIMASFASYAICIAFAAVPLGPWAISICTGVSTFFWVFVGAVTKDWLTGTPYDWGSIFASSLTYAIGSMIFPWATPWMHLRFPGTIGRLADALGYQTFKAWIGPKWTDFVAAVRQAFGNAEAAAPAEVIHLASADGLATPVATGQISSGIAGKCVDDNGDGQNNGNKVQLYDCSGSPAQSWTMYSNGNLSVGGSCLDIVGNGTANNTQVELWECNGAGGQVWQHVGNTLVNPQSGRCLDDPNGTSTNGTQLQIYDCIGGAAQQWSLPGGPVPGGGGGGGGGAPSGSVCDIYSFYGTSCAAAYSTTRALYSSYNGPLYQVQRASDGATTNIGLLGTGGDVNASEQDSFCGQYTCTITKIYDQSPNGNDLTIGPAGGVAGADRGAVASLLPVTVGGHEAYGVDITPGVGYRDNGARGIAVNGQPEGMYMVASGNHVNSGCCFDFGNAETNSNDNGNGHMDAVNLSTTCYFAPCNGGGPWVQADMENGLFQGGNGSNTANGGNSSYFVTAMLKNNGQNTYALEGGDAQQGGLNKWYDGALPNIGGYAPMHQEGGITLGVGGDNSNSSVGSFFEGVMTAGLPTDQADSAVQANIVAASYGGNPQGYATGGSPLGSPITMTANGAGQCVDILGDDTGSNGTVADVWSCQSYAVDQHWTHNPNGSLETMGRCLDIDGDGTAPGTKVELWDCNGAGGQVWQQQSNGSLYNPQSGLCLDDPSGSTTNGTVLQIWTCLGNQAQQFLVDGFTPTGGAGGGGGGGGGGGSGQSTAPPAGTVSMTANGANQCVDDTAGGSGVAGTVVDITTCNGAPQQSWTHNSNGTLTTLGLCLDIDGDGTAPGAKVELWTCNGAGGQVWQQYPNGSLYNPQSGLCLDDPSGSTANGTGLQIWNCLNNQAQEFSVNGGNPIPMLANGAGQCLDVLGNDNGGDGTVVDVWTCQSNAVDQHWVLNSNGSLETLGKCLDINGNGTAPGTKVELWDCNGLGGQVWQPRSNGELYNPQSGLCLDDPSGSTTNGTVLQIWTCLGNQAQNYAFGY